MFGADVQTATAEALVAIRVHTITKLAQHCFRYVKLDSLADAKNGTGNLIRWPTKPARRP